MTKADEISNSGKLNEFVHDLDKKINYGLVDKYPIIRWNDQIWIQIDELRLQPGPQRLTVIDITNDKFTAIFKWRGREYAVVLLPDEGHVSTLCEDLSYHWVHLADIVVRVEEGTKSDFQKLRETQMEELEISIDAGGSILD